MFFSDGGYSSRQYDPSELRQTAQRLAIRIPELMKRSGAQAVAVTGKSGMSLAFATLMLIDFPLIVVRKRGENSHGAPIEGTHSVDVRRYLVLDDFTDTGATVRSIMHQIDEQAEGKGEFAPECVGALMYARETITYGTVPGASRIPMFGVAST